MAITVVADNQTGADIVLEQLDVPGGVIPSAGSIALHDDNAVEAIQSDGQLAALIAAGDVTLTIDGVPKNQAESAEFQSPIVAQAASAAATETSAGIVEIATQAEADAGTDDARAVTPKKLAGRPLPGMVNGSIVETIDGTVTSDGVTITFALAKDGGGNLTVQLSGAHLIYVAGNVALTPGTDAIPVLSYLYIEDDGGATLKTSTTGFPATEHAPIATVLCQSAASLQTQGAYKVHLWTDHLTGVDSRGHISHMNKWIRSRNAAWESGGAPTLTIAAGPSPDTVDLATTAGMALQLHSHAFPAFDTATGSDVFVPNDSVTPFKVVTDLETMLTDSLGGSMSNRYYSLVFWLVVSEDSADCKLMCNLPSGSYGTQAGVDGDASKYADYSIPLEFRGTGVLIVEVKLRHLVAAGGQHTEIATIDLRGLQPSITAGGGLVQSSEFSDALFAILDSVDPTKRVEFDVSAVSPATTRKITMPDSDVVLGGGGGGIRTLDGFTFGGTAVRSTYLDHAWILIAQNDIGLFTWGPLPSDFSAVDSVILSWVCNFVEPAADVDLTGAIVNAGDPAGGSSIVDAATTYNFPVILGCIHTDVSALFVGIEAGDVPCLTIDNKESTRQFGIYGISFNYV